MKVRINIDKVAALKAGKDRHGLCVVDVPAESLTPSQRDTLADVRDYPISGENKNADFYLDQETSKWIEGENVSYREAMADIVEPNVDSVKLVLDRIAAINEAAIVQARNRQAEKSAKEESEAKAFLAKFEADHAVGIGTGTTYRNGKERPRFYPAGELRGQVHPLLEGAAAWAKTESDRLMTETLAEEAKRAAEDAARKEEERVERENGIVLLNLWAQEHGSDLLKARIQDGFDWVSLAEMEYVSSIVAPLGDQIEEPEGYEDSTVGKVACPSLETIQRLREVREAMKGKAEVSLDLIKYESDEDTDGDGNQLVLTRPEISVTVTAPTGTRHVLWYDASATVDA